MTNAELPDLRLIARRVDDELDHPDGGHCVSLSRTESEGTRELVAQYLTALRYLADRAAEAPDGRWDLTRPLLFHAHHTAELAVKSVLMTAGVDFPTRHGLEALWKSATDGGLDQLVSAVNTAWCHGFVSLIADLAGNSVGARYARPNAGHTALDDIWCCVNPRALAEATESFAVMCIAIAQEQEEASSAPGA